MGRSPCCPKSGMNKGAWTATEDKILTDYIKLRGEGKWGYIPKRTGLNRCGKSCRLRWLNYLRPDIKRGNITSDEEDLIIRLHKLLGNRWSLIAGRLPGRTDNEIKNYWNTNLSKRSQLAKESNNHKNTTITRSPNEGPSPSLDQRATSGEDQVANHNVGTPPDHSQSSVGLLGSTTSKDEENSSDYDQFDMGFSIDDISIPDFLRSELTNPIGLDCTDNSLVTDDLWAPEWSSGCLEADMMDSHFGSLLSFIESNLEWMV